MSSSAKKQAAKESSQVNPDAYFEQLEPRIILGSCLALGGAEAVMNQAHASENESSIYVAPPSEFNKLHPQNNLHPASQLPTLFSWGPLTQPFENDKKHNAAAESPLVHDWFAPKAGGPTYQTS